VLRDGGQPLVQQVLEREVVGANCEEARPKVGRPVLDRLDKADQFAFAGSQLGMKRHNDAPEERDRANALV